MHVAEKLINFYTLQLWCGFHPACYLLGMPLTCQLCTLTSCSHTVISRTHLVRAIYSHFQLPPALHIALHYELSTRMTGKDTRGPVSYRDVYKQEGSHQPYARKRTPTSCMHVKELPPAVCMQEGSHHEKHGFEHTSSPSGPPHSALGSS